MENLRKRVDVKLVSTEKQAEKLTAKPNFKHFTIFDENLVAVHMNKTQIYFNKPIHLGMSILDLSKTLMYDFHYNYIKKKYGDKAKLLFTDTDSLAYEIKTKDVYKDINPDVDIIFDTSNFPQDHPIKVGNRKRALGLLKDEAGGKQIIEFVGLRPKMYAYKIDDVEQKKCKGIKKPVVEKAITFEDYKKCLDSKKEVYRSMCVIRSYKHRR